MGSIGAGLPARYARNLAQYDKIVAMLANVDRKGASMPYTSVNGHMFSQLTKEGTLVLRLSTEAREAFVKKYKTPPVRQYGIVMPQYVEIPDELLAQSRTMKTLFEASYRYVSSLKPKPTTSKKPAAKRKS